jgi:hypothetical protein
MYSQVLLKVQDHDFPSLAQGVAIPHALYDLTQNIGYVTLGTSHDTSEFACQSLQWWWTHYGTILYPQATSILILCDCGGSNSARAYVFKAQLQQLADQLGIEIRIAHYPPYTSKYNPIEHRLFPHLTRAAQGVVLKSVEMLKQLFERASTKTGLKVIVQILDHIFLTGKKVAKEFKQNMTIAFDDFLPKWNYTAVPQSKSGTYL